MLIRFFFFFVISDSVQYVSHSEIDCDQNESQIDSCHAKKLKFVVASPAFQLQQLLH